MSEKFGKIELSEPCKCDKPNIGIIGYKKENYISIPVYKCYNCGAVFIDGNKKWKELADNNKE